MPPLLALRALLMATSAEVGKVTFKNDGDEVLNDEFVFKSNGNEALNDGFP
jgi:hypothetical protein